MRGLFALLVVALTTALPKWHQLQGYSFEQYVVDHGKAYEGQEFEIRKALFEKRMQEVQTHNSNPNLTWKQGINHMSDWTAEEYNSIKGYDKVTAHKLRSKRAQVLGTPSSNIALPLAVDWRSRGVVSSVKDQGRCGSCWTFAAAQTLESHYALAHGYLGELSMQHILDCTPNPDKCGGTGGCDGGTVELAYQTLMDNGVGGLATEWTYPYRSYYAANFTCGFNKSRTPVAAEVASYVTLPTNTYKPLLAAVATKGPIAISVDASSWKAYESGVFNGCNQTNPDIDHAVQLVGYGTDPKLGDYWLVRNSWGPKWGEAGYIRLKRSAGEEKLCGTDLTPRDGDGCQDGPPQQTVCGTCGILFDSAYPVVKK